MIKRILVAVVSRILFPAKARIKIAVTTTSQQKRGWTTKRCTK